MKNAILPFALAVALTASAQPDLFIGTHGFGHVSPAASTPHGAVQAGPDTSATPDAYVGDWPHTAGYQNFDRYVWRFSQNRFQGLGCGSMGFLGLLPSVNPIEGTGETTCAEMDKATETACPGYYAVTLKESAIRCEMAARPHAAAYRFTFPKGSRAYLLVDSEWGVQGRNTYEYPLWGGFGRFVLDGAVRLQSPTHALAHCRQVAWNEVEGYLAVEFSSPVVGKRLLKRALPWNGEIWEYDFGEVKDGVLELRLGLSAHTIHGAERNLAAEIPAFDFDGVRRQAAADWSVVVDAVSLDEGTPESVRRSFEAAFYRVFAHPSDIGDAGKREYSNMSCWDIFRSCMPLQTFVTPDTTGEIVASMIDIWDRNGYLPILHTWGVDNHCMIGHHAVPIIVDAYLKGIGGFDPERAYEAVKDSLTRLHLKTNDGTWGLLKEDWDVLDAYGYYPFDRLGEHFREYDVKGESVARTLECAYDDACAARFAEALGKTEDAAFFAKRAENWRNVFDASVGFMRGRDAAGNWREPFDPIALGGGPWNDNDFCEGNAWQYTYHVMQNPEGLIEAFGGRAKFVERLCLLFDQTPVEYTERPTLDVTGLIGQYAHGNEPSHHTIYFFTLAGRPDLTAKYVRAVFDTQYFDRADGLCGNDDSGAMAAWYVFSALGFYPFDPCGGEYVIGAPQIPGATMRLPNGRTLRIETKGFTGEVKTVRRATLNGRELGDFKIRHADLMAGGTLVYELD